MDIQMPVLDGHQATRRLRREGFTLPIVALTAHATENDRAACLAAGFDEYASKPISRAQLAELVQRYVNAERAERAERA
jgi:CheY-like chemotaxis protein